MAEEEWFGWSPVQSIMITVQLVWASTAVHAFPTELL